jgi:hypothetical protein
VKAINSAVANGSYYVNHATGAFTGNWGSYNGTTGVNGAGDLISIGQGFFIQTSSNGNFVMNNTVRAASSGAYYGPSRNALDNEIRLSLSNGTNSDEIVTYTDPQASVGFDPSMDAIKMPAGVPVYIGYHVMDKYYAINVMDNVDVNTVLPLTLYVTDNGTYTLDASTLNVTGLAAYLKDSLSTTLVDLSAGPVYLTLTGGQVVDRYSVVFKSTAAPSGIVTTDASATHIYSFGDKVYVNRSSNVPATISVSNIIGQEVKDLNTNTEKTVFDLPVTEPWYAIVKVTEGNKVTVAKVLISNK